MPTSINSILTQIEKGSLARGLDPAAVASVASVEGGFGGPSSAPGDGGTSFGPFQLHIGGKLPAGLSGQAAQTFAWSPGGINYALNGIAKSAKGLGGAASVSAIVNNFEQPADPAAEIKRALANYSQFQGGGSVPIESGSAADAGSASGSKFLPNQTGGTGLQIHPLQSLSAFLGVIGDPNTWIRILEIVGGSVIALAGLYLLVKDIGLGVAVPTPGPTAAVAKAVPA